MICFQLLKNPKTCKNVLVVAMVSIDQQSFVKIVTFCAPRLMVEHFSARLAFLCLVDFQLRPLFTDKQGLPFHDTEIP